MDYGGDPREMRPGRDYVPESSRFVPRLPRWTRFEPMHHPKMFDVLWINWSPINNCGSVANVF